MAIFLPRELTAGDSLQANLLPRHVVADIDSPLLGLPFGFISDPC